MDSSQATREVLLGIEVTLLGGILVLASSGAAAGAGLLIAGVGFSIALYGLLPDRRHEDVDAPSGEREQPRP